MLPQWQKTVHLCHISPQDTHSHQLFNTQRLIHIAGKQGLVLDAETGVMN